MKTLLYQNAGFSGFNNVFEDRPDERHPDKIIALIFLPISLLVLCLALWQIVFNEVTPCKKRVDKILSAVVLIAIILIFTDYLDRRLPLAVPLKIRIDEVVLLWRGAIFMVSHIRRARNIMNNRRGV